MRGQRERTNSSSSATTPWVTGGMTWPRNCLAGGNNAPLQWMSSLCRLPSIRVIFLCSVSLRNFGSCCFFFSMQPRSRHQGAMACPQPSRRPSCQRSPWPWYWCPHRRRLSHVQCHTTAASCADTAAGRRRSGPLEAAPLAAVAPPCAPRCGGLQRRSRLGAARGPPVGSEAALQGHGHGTGDGTGTGRGQAAG